MLDAAGYPCEAPVLVHPPGAAGAADAAGADFSPPKKKPAPGTTPLPPIIFRLRGEDDCVAAGGRTVVGRALFLEQFAAFTCHAFDAMTPEAWQNVVVAGGAVLGALLPLEQHWRRIAPSPFADESRDFVRRFRPTDQISRLEQDQLLTPAKYLREVRWKSSDVDIFVYGLNAEAADAKLASLLLLITKALKARGAGELAYVRTPNTVTVAAPKGEPFRKVQVVTRLYKSAAEVINTFDIDACCVSFDGTDAMCTPRARRAINAKMNIVDLSLRGAAYENRLIKYAQRGFMIGVPGLDKAKIDQANIKVRQTRSKYGWHDFEGDGFSWSKWQGSKGTLLRILLMEQVASAVGYFDDPFPGRLKREPTNLIAHVTRFHLLATDDDYPSMYKKGPPNFPASTKIFDLVGKAASGKLKVRWEPGSMPRTPMTFNEWAGSALLGHKSAEDNWAEQYKARREAAAKEAEVIKKAEEAEKEAMRQQLRAMKERLAAAEKSGVEAEKDGASTSAPPAAAGGGGGGGGGGGNSTSKLSAEVAALEKDKGNAAFREGEFELAVGHYSSALLAEVPRSAAAALLLTNRAQARLKLQQWESAELDCDASLFALAACGAPQPSAKTLLRRAQARLKRGRYAAAIADCRALAELFPGDVSGLADAGSVEAEALSKAHAAGETTDDVAVAAASQISATATALAAAAAEEEVTL